MDVRQLLYLDKLPKSIRVIHTVPQACTHRQQQDDCLVRLSSVYGRRGRQQPLLLRLADIEEQHHQGSVEVLDRKDSSVDVHGHNPVTRSVSRAPNEMCM